MMASGLRFLDIPFLDRSMFKQVIMSYNRYLVINFMNFLMHGLTSTSHLLLDFLDVSLYVSVVLICGACV